jgi:hypothetical protein
MEYYDILFKVISTLGFPIAVAIYLLYKDYKFTARYVLIEEREAELLQNIRHTMQMLSEVIIRNNRLNVDTYQRLSSTLNKDN